jgi:D-sedoheptulose 7-phosphate isomerase
VAGNRAQVVAETLSAAIRLHERVMAMDPAPLLSAAELIVEALRRDGKVLAFGNGGSAADAQHLAAELVTRFARERRAFAAVALAADAAVVTSIGNDFGFERLFARQVEALGRPRDVAFAISTSGASPNVVAGLVEARALGLRTIALTGRDGGAVGAAADVHVNVPDESPARVQEVHRTLLHAICELVERELTTQE